MTSIFRLLTNLKKLQGFVHLKKRTSRKSITSYLIKNPFDHIGLSRTLGFSRSRSNQDKKNSQSSYQVNKEEQINNTMEEHVVSETA